MGHIIFSKMGLMGLRPKNETEIPAVITSEQKKNKKREEEK